MTAKHHEANYILNSFFNIWLDLGILIQHSSQFTDGPFQSSLTEGDLTVGSLDTDITMVPHKTTAKLEPLCLNA